MVFFSNYCLLLYRNYWRDCDTALFILKHLYKDVPEDPNLLEGSSRHNSKDESSSTGWIDRSEIKEEELPLTFSNRMMVKNFSRKAKKFMKMNWVLTRVLLVVISGFRCRSRSIHMLKDGQIVVLFEQSPNAVDVDMLWLETEELSERTYTLINTW